MKTLLAIAATLQNLKHYQNYSKKRRKTYVVTRLQHHRCLTKIQWLRGTPAISLLQLTILHTHFQLAKASVW